MVAFPSLFSPIRIAGLELRNRLVMSPMETSYADEDGVPSQRMLAYYEARAKGGVGLITLGACTIDEQHREVPRSIDFGRDEVLDAHRELTDRVHAHGARIQPQLVHPGPDGLAPYLAGVPNIGPSVIPSYLTGLPCRELEAAELPAIIDRYRAAALRVRSAGYDGIELHAAHGYMLLGSFLTPMRNRRTDEYAGNSEAGRIRLILEVVRAIKGEVGADFPLSLRISGYERAPGGRSIDDTARIAPKLVAAGVDAFHVSGGVIDPLTSQMVAGSQVPDGHNVAAASAVKRAVDVPVIAVGRIHDPQRAEQILREGHADLVAMGRPLLADPELANKARMGRFGELRRCISCEHCIDSMEKGRLSCAVNPFTGNEGAYAVGKVDEPKKVVVIGGGPAGMEAARIAALRGHEVALYEREHLLGGALRIASMVHPENRAFLEFQRAELERLAVSIHLGQEMRPHQIGALRPDAAIVATGGRVVAPQPPGHELPHVLSGAQLRELVAGRVPADAATKLEAWQRLVLRSIAPWLGRFSQPQQLRRLTRFWMPLAEQVAIVGADLAAIELSEFLAERGRRVTVVEGGAEIAPEVGPKRRGEHMERLDRLGVCVLTGRSVERITESQLVLGGDDRVRADSVILAGEARADTRLYDALCGRLPEVHAIGDCTGPGLIRKATEDAARVISSL